MTHYFKKALFLMVALSVASCGHGISSSSYLPDRATLQPGETITVKGNENIYVVAHEHNVSMRDLIALNNLRPPFEIKAGQKLVLPANGTGTALNELPPPEPAPLLPVEKNAIAPIEPPSVTSQPLEPLTPPQQPSQPQSLVVPSQPLNSKASPTPDAVVTSDQAAQPQAPIAAGTPSAPMIWPVQGPILSNFGAKGAGLSNDGINIGAPKGAPVVASAPGTVVYAGDEMKGFGNLVLIRHENNWVTAYAHLDRVMVKKDSIVAQGDMIGTIGKTGNVPSPQLHFEIREDGKPVDPAQIIKTIP